MSRTISDRKLKYRAKLEKLLADYHTILVVTIDNVGSKQMQQVRMALRGKAVMLMGKNTIMRKVIREYLPNNPNLEGVLNCLYNNVGLVFTNSDPSDMRTIISENKVPAAARSGAYAPIDVYVPPGPTGLDPGQTSFFQALNIATKISRGAIEILNQVHLVFKGERVSSSAVSLLQKLGIKPFFFGIDVVKVYENGCIYDASILDMTDDILLGKFFNGVAKVASLSLQIGWPTLASLPHSLARAFKNILALAVMTDYTFKEAEKFKLFLSDPAAYAEKYGAVGGGGGGGAAASGGGDAPAAAAVEEEEDEEEEDGGGMDLFGGDEEGDY